MTKENLQPAWSERKEKLCYLCAEPLVKEDRTNDHFLSKAFYVDGKLPNRSDLSLPAHGVCNKSTDLDEEKVANALAFCRPFPDEPKDERFDRAIRSLTHEKKQRYLDAFMRGLIDLGDLGAAVTLGDSAVWVLVRIAKALWFMAEKTPLPQTVPWTVRTSTLDFFIEHAGVFATFSVDDVLYTSWGYSPTTLRGLWLICLRGHFFTVSTSPLDPGEKRNDFTGRVMQWPKRRPSLVEVQYGS